MPIKKTKSTGSKCDCSTSCCGSQSSKSGGPCNSVYGLGIFGAAFYFFPLATDFGGYALAVLKSLLWPAFLVYQAMVTLGL